LTASFATTRWTLVLDAGRHARSDADGASARALADLCTAYRPPLLGHALRRGLSQADADDAVQGFFARLLRLESLATLRPRSVCFRAWLLAAFNHHLADLRDHARAARRDVRLEAPLDDAVFAATPEPSPDRAFDRAWALTLLQTVSDRLRAEQTPERAPHFDLLLPALAGRSGAEASQAELAARLDISEPALRVLLHRLRHRFRALLRDEIAHTVAASADIDAELRHLFAALETG
jgi:RNA polymerase sigma-70 factor (ECF subfamily)